MRPKVVARPLGRAPRIALRSGRLLFRNFRQSAVVIHRAGYCSSCSTVLLFRRNNLRDVKDLAAFAGEEISGPGEEFSGAGEQNQPVPGEEFSQPSTGFAGEEFSGSGDVQRCGGGIQPLPPKRGTRIIVYSPAELWQL